MNKNESIYMLSGTDALGRKVKPVGSFNGKQVGVFYFLWIGQHGSAKFDNSVLSAELQRNDRSGEDVHHFWAKPMFGYYDSGDAWVFRKHLQMLTLAGVDYLVFDTTNSYYYEEVCHNIFPVALQMLSEGWNIPKFIFDTNCRSSETVEGIYKEYYDPDTENGKRYAPLWYRHPDHKNRNAGGKPWIIAKNNETGDNVKYNYGALPEKIRNFFYLRESAWFKEDETPYAFATDVDTPHVHEGMLSVSVAQHTSGAFSDSVFEEGKRDSNRGRGYSHTDGRNDAGRIACGSCFEEEWDRALSDKKVDNVFLTTWNEWVAQKQPFGANGRSCCYFVDQYNVEFSRDIEPADNELADNYYMQMVRNIRAFKGKGKVKRTLPFTADIRKGESGFGGAKTYSAFSGDGIARNYKSANSDLPAYSRQGADNDITQVRVSCDKKYVYFRIECADKISQAGGNHLNVLIMPSENGKFVISDIEENKAQIRFAAGDEVKTAGIAECVTEERAVNIKAERALLDLTGGECTFEFKVTDGIDGSDAVNYYTVGKSVPYGRLNYYFSCKCKAEAE